MFNVCMDASVMKQNTEMQLSFLSNGGCSHVVLLCTLQKKTDMWRRDRRGVMCMCRLLFCWRGKYSVNHTVSCGTGKGRALLLMYAFVLVMTYPMENFHHNTEVMSQSTQCGQEAAYNATKEVMDVALAPVKSKSCTRNPTGVGCDKYFGNN